MINTLGIKSSHVPMTLGMKQHRSPHTMGIKTHMVLSNLKSHGGAMGSEPAVQQHENHDVYEPSGLKGQPKSSKSNLERHRK